MGLREVLNGKPAVAAGGAIAAVAIAVGLLYLSMAGGGPRASSRDFFSDDDGKTWFADDATRLPPFDHGGKTAYLAHVYTCDGRVKFVGYLERIRPEAQTRIAAILASGTPVEKSMVGQIRFDNIEVKKPGDPDTAWARSGTPAFYQTVKVPCPGGKSTDLTYVLP